jgi:hypothetical protein
VAVRTSTQSGNTHSAPFAVGTTVVDGDQLQVTNTAHAVTFDQSCTLGISTVGGAEKFRPTVTNTGSGGSLPAGAYRVRVVPVSGAGSANAGAPSTDSLAATITAGQVIRVTLPALPGGATAWDVYVTNTTGAAASEHRYATNKTGATFDCSSASWEDGTTTYAAAAALPFSHAVGYPSTVTAHAGGFTVNDGVTVTLKGDMAHLGTVTINSPTAASGFTFDPSSGPSGTVYRMFAGTVDANGTAKVVLRGSSTSRSFVQSASTTGQGNIDTAILTSGTTAPVRLDCQWFLFSKLGGSGYAAIECNCTAASYTQALSDGIFDPDCREFHTVGIPATSGWNINRVSFRQTNGNTYGTTVTCCALQVAADVTTGTRTLQNCSFWERPPCFSAGGAVYSDLYLGGCWMTLSASGGSAGSTYRIDRAFVRQFMEPVALGLPDCPTAGSSDIYLYIDWVTGPAASDLNPHGPGCGAGGVGTTRTHDRWTVEYNGSSNDGDMFKNPGSNAGTVQIRNALLVPNAADLSSGSIFTFPNNPNSGYRLEILHCTYFGGPYSLSTSEGGLQPAGTVGACKSNLVFEILGTGGFRYVIGKSSGDGQNDTTDIASPANVSNNAGWNLQDVTGNWVGAYSWYNTKFSSAPGAGDVDLGDSAGADISTNGPKFFDPSRKFVKWCERVLGATGTTAQKITYGLDRLKVIADTTSPNFILGLAVTDPATWVRNGFQVRNTLLLDAGHDGVTIGAMNFVTSAPPEPGVPSVPPPKEVRMIGRFYAVTYNGTITAAGGNTDLLSVQPADDKPVYLLGWSIGQTSEVGDTQEEGLRVTVQVLPATFTVGSGGTLVTAQPPVGDNGGPAWSFTARCNDTAVATTSGTAIPRGEFGWNERATPWDYWYPHERLYPYASQGQGLVVRNESTANDDLTGSVTFYLLEVG